MQLAQRGGFKLFCKDLTRGILREAVHEEYVPWHLERSELFLKFFFYLKRIAGAVPFEDDAQAYLLAVVVVRDADGAAVRDLRIFQCGAFDLGRADVLAPSDYQVFDAAGKAQVPVFSPVCSQPSLSMALAVSSGIL